MNSIKKRKLGGVILDVVYIIFIFFIFFILLFRYYWITDDGNPRFVEVDYEKLQKEASAIEINSYSTKKYAENVFVLNYHLVTRDAPTDQYEISHEQFKENMFALKSQGYQTVNLEDLYSFMRGEKELPDKSFVLTFDDGAKASYYNVDPILQVLNYTAVMFVITSYSIEPPERAYYLNKSELIEMEKSGRWELGSHTYQSHSRLPIGPSNKTGVAFTNKLWIPSESRLETNDEYYNRIQKDLQISKRQLEETINKPVNSFALAFGDFGERQSNYPGVSEILRNLTRESYSLIFYQFKPTRDRDYRANYKDEGKNSYLIVRLSVDNVRSPEELLEEIEASRTSTLPYYENYSNENKWPRVSGSATFKEDRIILKDNPEDEGGEKTNLMAYLDGSYLWENYYYVIKLKNSNAQTVMLLSRYKSSIDYTACRFSSGFVRIINVNDNKYEIIKNEKLLDGEYLTNETVLSMYIKDSNVSCFIDGKRVAEGHVPGILPHGGVGIKAEDFTDQNKTFEFGGISVINTGK